jgi:hypothetical protein
MLRGAAQRISYLDVPLLDAECDPQVGDVRGVFYRIIGSEIRPGR